MTGRLVVRWLNDDTGDQCSVAYAEHEVRLGTNPTRVEILNTIEDMVDRADEIERIDPENGRGLVGHQPLAYGLDGGPWQATPLKWRVNA
jgi:hypothetical protein